MGEYDGILVQKPIRSNDKVVTGSHYDDRDDDRRLKYGRSRDPGDVSPEVQRQVIGALVAAGKKAGLNDHDIAAVIAIVRYESGFNPDAANRSSDAASLGQFRDRTRKQYGVKTVFDITTNAEAVVHCYKDSKAIAISQGHAGSQEELDRWTYGFYHDGPYGSGSKGSKIFSNSNGVKTWIDPAEKSIGHPEGARHPRSSGLTDDPGGSFAGAGTPDPPFASVFNGVPNPPGPVSSGSPGLPQAPVGYNFFTGKPISAALPPSPGQAPFSLYGNLLTGAPPTQPDTADPRLAPFFPYTPSPVSYPASSANLLTSPPTIFQGPYRTGYAPVRQAQEMQPASGKPFYSLKDRLDFLGNVYRVAKPLSDETGISLPFILAHAAHEVDFGKKIEGNNLFNITADETWRGPTYTKGDKAYRSYPSYEESKKDYLEYLQSNPRYGKMFEPVTRQSLGRLVDAIHYAGYSDDPLYGHRILAASKDPMMKRALWQFDKWQPKATGEG